MTDDLLPRLQALLTRWDEQAATAARRLERSKNPTGGAYYAGAMFGYEECADDLAMVLKEFLASEVDLPPRDYTNSQNHPRIKQLGILGNFGLTAGDKKMRKPFWKLVLESV